MTHGTDAVFSGTVDYYARYRPDFPAAAYEAIRTTFGLDGHGTLLDLGTGTGHIALRLAPLFEEVIAIDVNDEMLAVARGEAARSGRTNIAWQLGRAEDVGLTERSVRTVTIGNALHWMDRDRVFRRCLAMLAPHGGIAILDMPGMWSPAMELGGERWLATLHEVVERHLGTRRRAGAAYYEPQHETPADSLDRAGFLEIETGAASFDLDWSADEVVGYVYSTSFANREVLGDRVEAFESDLREALAVAQPGGRFTRRLEARWALGRA